MIAVCATDARLARVLLAGIVTWRSNENRRRAVHAQVVAGGIVDQILRVKRPAKVNVKIATFGHVTQESQLKRRLPADGFEIARRPLLSTGSRLRLNHRR